jgi:hypothetical protein
VLKFMPSLAVLVTLLGPAARGAAAGPVALFDEGHGQRFLAGRSGELDLSGLAAEFREAGMEVRIGRGRLDPAALHGVAVLVVSGAFAPIAPEEVETIRAFVGSGGKLALMLHIGQPAQSLLERIGIQYSRGPIHETAGVIGGRDLDFASTRFSPHDITRGLRSLSVFGCWALKNFNPEAAEIARTGKNAWLDSDGNGRLSPGEPVGEHALVVAGTLGDGAYVVFGDDAIFQNRFLGEYNRDLARRLARWLAGAPAGKSPSAPRPGGIKL